MSKEDTVEILKRKGYEVSEINRNLMIFGGVNLGNFGLGEIDKNGSVKICDYPSSPCVLGMIKDIVNLRNYLKQNNIIYTESGIDEARKKLEAEITERKNLLDIL